MRYSRPEISGRVDSVARRPAERQPDGEDQQTDDQRLNAEREYRREVYLGSLCDLLRVRNDCQHAEDQHGGPDDLGDKVGYGVAVGGRSAEHAELESRILRRFPVRQVGEPHYDTADESSEKLSDDVAWYLSQGEGTNRGETYSYGRVDVRSADSPNRVNGHRNPHRPSEGDDDPARVLGLGVLEQYPGDDPVAQDDEDHGADKLGEIYLHSSLLS